VPVTDLRRATWLVLVGIVSVQVGAALSKNLFGAGPAVTPTSVVWLRLVTSTVLLLALARPRVRGRSREDWAVVLTYGAVLAAMNWSIYQSFARIPLGIAVTIEFLGPLTVAVLGSRRPLDLVWVVLAGGGVLLLGLERAALDLVGVLFALLAGAMWATYIPLSAATGRRWPGLSGLAVASVVGTATLGPYVVAHAGTALLAPVVLGTGLAVGVLSSVVPYSLELVALRTMPAKVFGILMSLDPAAAALAGLALVGEQLTAVQWLALACVVVASVGVTRTARPVGSGQVATA
jgi:inner membrane transporter RhtA